MTKPVLILIGSDSDVDVMLPALRVLKDFEVGCELKVLSVHRAPDLALAAASEAKAKGVRVIIAAAGWAAHLAGAAAAKTTLPVIGVPIDNGPLRGVDALYATVQMPPGVPVATVAVNGAANAALLAVEILALSDARLAEALDRHKEKLVAEVAEKDRRAQARIEKEGLA
jgi:phosphoribosylaminoimidazole carboxylase PurE protein